MPPSPVSSSALLPRGAFPLACEVFAEQDGRLPHLLLLAGSLMVLVTCAAYVMAGPVAAMPAGADSFAEGRAATPDAVGWMLLASWAGMPGDLLLAVAGLMLARRGGQPAQAAAGWWALSLVGFLFLLVDMMVGQVLPPLAMAGPELAPAYAGARVVFDALFHLGTFAGGLSALAIAWAPGGRPRRWGPLLGGAGMLGVAGGGAGLLGLGFAPLTGGAVTLLALALAGWAWVGLRSAG
jgi:hypothetical protein